MPSFRFSESANADLEEIASYTLESWDAAQTIIYLDDLEKTVNNLAGTPKLGKRCNDLSKGLRSFPYESHVIYYLEKKKGVVIARVLHERMSTQLQFELSADQEGRA